MPYKKEFNKDKTEVIITATGDSRWFWVAGKEERVKEKTFEVVEEEKIYSWIDNGNPMDLQDKYIKAFSLKKYRYDMGLSHNDKVYLKDFDAERAFFDEGADFSNVVFEGEGNVSFGRANFGDGNVCFVGANFGDGNVCFVGATFGEGDVNFDSAMLNGDLIDFRDSSMANGTISFRGTNFKKCNRVYFASSKFASSRCELIKISFDGKNFSFRNAEISVIKIWSTLRGDLDLRVKNTKLIDLSDSKIYGNIDLDRDFTGKIDPHVEEIRLINTKLYGTIHMDYDVFNMPDAINDQGKKTTHREKRDQFRLLKENFRKLGQYDDEDKAYRWFMYHKIRDEGGFDIPIPIKVNVSNIFKVFYKYPIERSIPFYLKYYRRLCRRVKYMANHIGTQSRSLTDLKKELTQNSFEELNLKTVEFLKTKNSRLGNFFKPFIQRAIRFPVFAFKWLVFEKMGVYGTSPARVALSMTVVLAIFTLIYIPLTGPNATNPSPLFHSVITFLTIGYGNDYISMNSFWSQFFSGIEGFLGLFLMSYFTISFVRKVLR